MGKVRECWDECCYNLSWDWDECKYYLLCAGIVVGVVLLAVLVAAFGFVRHVDITVDDASLTRFQLTTSPVTSLSYNLSLTLVIRNPNWAMSLTSTKPLEAEYRFDGQAFDRFQLAGKGEKHPAGKTRVYHLAPAGTTRSGVMLGNAGESEFRKENATGTFQVEVAVAGEVRYTARYTKCKVEASCPLTLQLAPPGSSAAAAVVFQKVKCKLAKPEKNC